MQCRTLDAPAPWAAGTTGPPVATPCDASPDLGLLCCRRSRVRAHSSPHRPRHATPATNSLSTLQLIAAAALAGPPRGGRAAGRYAHTSSPQRLAAKLAPRGQARLWGTIATPTQRNAGECYANADATGRSTTDADATGRARKHCNADATIRTGTLPNSATRRGYKATLDRSVTLETPAVGKRWTVALSAITAS